MSRTQDAENIIGQVRDQASAVAGKISDVAHEQYDNLRDTAGEVYENTRRKAEHWQEEASDYVSSQPMKSLLIAVGIGVALGVLWKRR